MAGNPQTTAGQDTGSEPAGQGGPGVSEPASQVHWWGEEPRDEPSRSGTPTHEREGAGWPSPWDRPGSADTQSLPQHGSTEPQTATAPLAAPGGPGGHDGPVPPGSTGGGWGQDVPPSFQAPAAPSTPAGRRNRHRWLDMALAAVVAAVVAAGTTAGVMATDDGGSPVAPTTSSSSTGTGSGSVKGPVVQASGQPVDWTAVAKAVEPSVVAISARSQFGGGEGSGVILDERGHVLTNNHVATAGGSGGQLSVTLNDGRSYDATVVGTDPSTDLAVLQMKGAEDITPATLGDSDAVEVGEPVMAVGNPLGLAGTVTTGIVSALDRPVTTTNDEGNGPASQSTSSPVVTNAIQTDAAVNPGNSGGALVDSSGKVIGVPSSIASLGSSFGGQSGSIGLGFSIPINEAKSIADQLISHGKAEHPLLGVTLKDGSVKDGNATRTAAVIAEVSNGTPAASAGLRSGDAFIKVDDERVHGSESLVAQVRERNVGSRVSLTLLRDGKEQTVQVTLASRSSD
jgi:putative serine protease PepD